jgi:hypothetical protein
MFKGAHFTRGPQGPLAIEQADTLASPPLLVRVSALVIVTVLEEVNTRVQILSTLILSKKVKFFHHHRLHNFQFTNNFSHI